MEGIIIVSNHMQLLGHRIDLRIVIVRKGLLGIWLVGFTLCQGCNTLNKGWMMHTCFEAHSIIVLR